MQAKRITPRNSILASAGRTIWKRRSMVSLPSQLMIQVAITTSSPSREAAR